MNEQYNMSAKAMCSMLSTMIRHAWKRSPIIFRYFIGYTITASIYPLASVLLPKLLIPEIMLPQPSLQSIFQILGGYYAGIAILGYTMTMWRTTAYPIISEVRMSYIGDMMHKLSTMDYEHTEDATFFDRNEMAIEAFSSNNNGIEGIYHEIFQLPAILITVIILSITIARLSPIVLVGLVLHVVVISITKHFAQSYKYTKKDELGHASRRKQYYYTTTHDFGYGKDIRIFSFKNRILSNYKEEIASFLGVQKDIFQKSYVLSLITLVSLAISNVAIYGMLILRSLQGMNIADFTMYLTAILSAMMYLQQCADKITTILNEAPYVRDFYSLINSDLITHNGVRKPIVGDTLEIEFRDVSFKYPNTNQYIFKNLNLTINKGERMAIVGINGAGKTTLVKLMVGLFPVTEGCIFINGIPIDEFSKDALYSMFSVVFQDVNILAYTIRENVTCQSDAIDEERVKQSIEKVGLMNKVNSFDNGLDQMLLKVIDEKGTELSGGESQKLSIARALYKDANMVIMDEPTAALDALAEAEIYENFSTLIASKTALYISHRLASTKFCDKIALFDKDGLRELGTHDELMKLQGSYFEMFTIQGKYYQEGELSHG